MLYSQTIAWKAKKYKCNNPRKWKFTKSHTRTTEMILLKLIIIIKISTFAIPKYTIERMAA